MASATIGGIATRYEVLGDGPPLLMYAPGGFDATIEKWRAAGVYERIRLLEHLPKKYRCIAFDRRECGQSGGRVEPLTWRYYADHGKALLEHLGVERAHLIGGCMGCSCVMAFAVAYPAATRSMILWWPVGGAAPEALLKLEIPALIVPGRDESHATSAARYLEECLPKSQYWDALPEAQTEAASAPRLLQFLDAIR